MTTTRLRIGVVAISLLLTMAAFSQDSFPGASPNRSILKAQEKADSYFAKSEFGKAMSIYRDDLAPVGDKYSQYMIGYMYLAGKGVQEDAIVASAWYRLAAQRENTQYVRICDGLLALFNDEQLSRSDQLYIDLRRDMGDLMLVQRKVREDIQILRRRTASELFLQAEMKRGSPRYQREQFDEAVTRMESLLEFLERRMVLESTLDDSEKEVLTTMIGDAERLVDAYKVSR